MRRSRWTHNKPCEVLSLQSLVDSCHQDIHCSSSPHSPRYSMDSHETFQVTSPLRSDGNLCRPCAASCVPRSVPAETWQPACSQCRPIIPCYEKHWRSWYRNHKLQNLQKSTAFSGNLLWIVGARSQVSWAHHRIVCTKLSVDLFTSPWEVIHKWLRYRYRCEHTLRFDAAGRNWTDPFKMIYDIWLYDIISIPTQSQMIS